MTESTQIYVTSGRVGIWVDTDCWDWPLPRLTKLLLIRKPLEQIYFSHKQQPLQACLPYNSSSVYWPRSFGLGQCHQHCYLCWVGGGEGFGPNSTPLRQVCHHQIVGHQTPGERAILAWVLGDELRFTERTVTALTTGPSPQPLRISKLHMWSAFVVHITFLFIPYTSSNI